MTAIHVTPLEELRDILHKTKATRWVSFAAPGKSQAAPRDFHGERLKLEFHDIGEPCDGLQPPTRDDADRLIAFINGSDGDLVLQCWMGVSRSTAAGLIALVLKSRHRDCESAAISLREAAPFATPNPLLIAHADDILQLKGKLVEAARGIGRGTLTDRGRPFTLRTPT